MKHPAAPANPAIVATAVAVVRCSGGNQIAEILGPAVNITGPASPMTNCETWANLHNGHKITSTTTAIATAATTTASATTNTILYSQIIYIHKITSDYFVQASLLKGRGTGRCKSRTPPESPSGGLGCRLRYFGHGPCLACKIRVKFGEISTFCSLISRAEILHKDQYKAYVLSKSELHSGKMLDCDARGREFKSWLGQKLNSVSNLNLRK